MLTRFESSISKRSAAITAIRYAQKQPTQRERATGFWERLVIENADAAPLGENGFMLTPVPPEPEGLDCGK